MQRPVTCLGYGGGNGTAGLWAYAALSDQGWKESVPKPTSSTPLSTAERKSSPESRPPRGIWWRVLSYTTSVLLVLSLCFGVFLGYGLLNNRWYHVLVVEGGSMEPAIGWGDLIVITKPPNELKPGMVITMQVNDKIVTHRVLQVDPLVTQGDANGVPDTWKAEDVRVVGVVQFHLPKLGRLLDAIRLGGAGSSAFFRDSAQVGGRVGAGQWENAEEEVIGECDSTLSGEIELSLTDLAPKSPPEADPGDEAEPPSVSADEGDEPLPALPEDEFSPGDALPTEEPVPAVPVEGEGTISPPTS